MLYFSTLFFLVLSEGTKFCPSAWHYLPGELICIIFGTTAIGDVSWSDAYHACQSSSGQLLLLHQQPSRWKEIEEILHRAYRAAEKEQVDVLRRGAWVGQPRRNAAEAETNDDLLFNCYVLTLDPTNSSALTLRSRPCNQSSSFICQSSNERDSWEEIRRRTVFRIDSDGRRRRDAFSQMHRLPGVLHRRCSETEQRFQF